MRAKAGNEAMTDQAWLEALAPLIALRSVVGDKDGNRDAVEFLSGQLVAIGFEVTVDGQTEVEQPVIVAHRPETGGRGRLLLYGHYDVVPVGDGDTWQTDDPFIPELIGERVFARGIADNKGPLFARLLAVRDLVARGDALPEILWMIHGSEEAGTPCETTRQIFEDRMADYRADLYLEETGFNDIETGDAILFLWSPSGRSVPPDDANRLQTLAQCDRIERRPLNKFNGGRDCPFLNALPEDALYLGFGPNDRQHRIHQNDESLDLERLQRHYAVFKGFIRGYAHG